MLDKIDCTCLVYCGPSVHRQDSSPISIMEGLTNKRQEVSRSDKKRQEVSRSVKNMFLLIISNIYY